MHAPLVSADGASCARMLWNDGRSDAQCTELERHWPALREGDRQHRDARLHRACSPGCANTRRPCSSASPRCCCPRARLRWKLTGDFAEDISDASGALWLDRRRAALVGGRAGCHRLTLAQMPRLVEAARWPAARPELAARGHAARAAAGRWRGRQRGQRGGRGRRAWNDAFVSLQAPQRACSLGHHREVRAQPGARGACPSAMRCRTPGTRWACCCRPPPASRGGPALPAATSQTAGRDRRRRAAQPGVVRALPQRRAHAAQRHPRARRFPRPGRRHLARQHDAGRARRRGLTRWSTRADALRPRLAPRCARPRYPSAAARSPLWCRPSPTCWHHPAPGWPRARSAAPSARHGWPAWRRATPIAVARRTACAASNPAAERSRCTRERHHLWQRLYSLAREFAR